MNTVWSFGDSFSTPYNQSPYIAAGEYIQYKGYTPKIFSEIIADNLKYDCFINAGGGLDNYSIFQNLCDVSDKVNDGDIILIGWSHINRFRIVNTKKEWLPILPFTRLTKFEDFDLNILDKIGVNRFDNENLYADEINSWIKLINKAHSNCVVFHWSPFPKTKINTLKFKNITTISKETKNEIDDGHYSEIGHQELATIFMNMISKKQKNELI